MFRVTPMRGRGHNKSSLAVLICAATVLPILATLPCPAQARPTEFQVKAAYVYNFGKFVTWPPNASMRSEVFQICILGRDPFAGVLDATVFGESINGKKIVVRRISRVQDATPCSVLFISRSEEPHLTSILLMAQHLNVLTVSDIKNFAERGGMIGLVTQDEKIRFVVNRKAADDAHLELSSELLKVASRVIEANTTE